MTYTAEIAPRSTRPGGARPLLVRGLLSCLSGTALVGIYAVVLGDFTSTGLRVLASTLLMGLYCVLCLAHVSVLDTRFRPVGTVGICAGSAALAQGLLLLWTVGSDLPDDLPADLLWFVARGFLLTAIVAFALAHAALLLQLDLDPASGPSRLRAATLIALGLVATLLALPVLDAGPASSFGYWRLLGVVAILDVLGTVALPVLARSVRPSTLRPWST